MIPDADDTLDAAIGNSYNAMSINDIYYYISNILLMQ